MKSFPGAALLAAALTGCATPQPGSPAPGAVCSNSALDQFVGKLATADLGAQILGVSGAKNLQWIPPGTMVTMDYREDRVRVTLDEQNKVQKVSCG